MGASRASERASEESLAKRALDRLRLEARRGPLEAAEALWREVDVALLAAGLEPDLPIPRIEHVVERHREEAAAGRTLTGLAREMREVESDREALETRIEVLESRRKTLPILIDPTDLFKRWKPFFIECDEGGATAYRATDDFQYFVPHEEISTSGDFGRYLRRVRATPGSLLVLLVRPDGIGTARRAYEIASQADLRVAQLPLPGAGQLDWSLLRSAEGGD